MADLAPTEPVHTIDEIAKRLRISPRTVLRAVERGHLRAMRPERQWRVTDSELRRWLEAKTTEPQK